MKIIFQSPAKVLSFVYKLLIKNPFFVLYTALRKIKKIFQFFKSEESLAKKIFLHYGSLIIFLILGLTIVVSNLQAEDVKSETYGQQSLVYQLTKSSDSYWEAEILSEEIIEEGPISGQSAPRSYLEGSAITAKPENSQAGAGLGSLISTTQDKSAIIAPDITDPEAIIQSRDKIVDYVVQPGDTISTIATKFNITTNTILWENNLSYYSTIKPGQTLTILPVIGISHTIKKGDNLRSIAKEYEGDSNEILEFNKLASADDLQIGQKIIIPGGKKEVVYSAAPSVSVADIFSAPSAPITQSELEWPTNSYRITQYYNWRHTGLDIGNSTGQPIYAAENGKVEAAGWNNSGYGYYIIINHGGGLKTLYAHLSRIHIKNGQNIQRGQVIGDIGSTGRSTGPHLHFEVRINNARVNPLGYIK